VTARKKIAIIASLLIVSSCLSGGAWAAQLGAYVGGGVGYSKRDFDQTSLRGNRDALLDQLAYTVLEQGPEKTTDTSLGYWANLGYRATAHWAFEGSYARLASLEYKSTANQGFASRTDFGTSPPTPFTFPGPSTTKFKIDDNVLELDALYIIPRGYRWEFYGRGGLSVASTKVDARINDGAGLHTAQVSTSSNTYHAGVGFTYSLLEVYGLRVEYKHTFALGGTHVVGGEHQVDSLTLGVIVAF
jgi:Outer membrane protein beta-barrel domain